MLVYVLLTTFTVVASFYAIFMGTIAEKSAGVTMLFVTFVATLIILFASSAHATGVLLVIDGLLAVYFAHLAFNFPKPWIRAVVALMAIQCALHGLFLGGVVSHLVYATGNNVVLTLTLSLLTLGTWQSRRDQGRGPTMLGIHSRA